MRHIPNLITFSRIAVLIALVWLVMQEWTGAATLAFLCILYGSVSDFLDGYIARKYEFITDFGKIMDATVDKVMTIGLFFLLIYVNYLPQNLIVITAVVLMTFRELAITLLRFVAAKKKFVLAAEKSGKRKTIWQTTCICVVFGAPMVQYDWQEWIGQDLSLFADYVLLNGYMYFALASWLTIASGYIYLRKYGKVFWTDPGDWKNA